MHTNKSNFENIKSELSDRDVALVAVSKMQPVEKIRQLYDLGQRDFGENYVQELIEKEAELPKDIRWHFIGHLQTNKVKYIAPFVHLIHGADSEKLLKEINKQGAKNNRVISCLLQVHIADEETKHGFNESDLHQFFADKPTLEHVQIKGLMGMGTLSDDEQKTRNEFKTLKGLFDRYFVVDDNKNHNVLSMGMSGDYHIAIEEGSNMVRIGSLLFGNRGLH